MCIERLTSSSQVCPCGCGQVFPIFRGLLKYGEGREAVFQAAHLSHCDSGPHVWFLLGSGPWFTDDNRDCWVTMQLWVDEETVTTRIEDPQKSPFWPSRDELCRYLTRDEVMEREGGKDWAIQRRLDFENHHPATQEFLQSQ